jgi:hypothetical protein
MDPDMMARGWTCYSILRHYSRTLDDVCFAQWFADHFGMGQVPVVRMLVYVGNPERKVR